MFNGFDHGLNSQLKLCSSLRLDGMFKYTDLNVTKMII